MEVYLKWLGEVVWRMAKWPEGARANEKDEHFWFLTYGISGLVVSMVAGVYLITRLQGPFSSLVALATTYAGADKLLAQGYIGAILVLLLGVPAVIAGVFLTATVITVTTTLILLITKVITQGLANAIASLLEAILPESTKKTLAFAAIGGILGAIAGVMASNVKPGPSGVVPPPPGDPDLETKGSPPVT